MDWNQMHPRERAKYLDAQLKEVKAAIKLLERFEKLSERWLKKTEALAAKKQG